MKKLLSALVVLALCSSVAMATVPSPQNCSVQPGDGLLGVVLCPDSPAPIPASIYTVNVRNSANNPIPNAAVTFDFPNPPSAGIKFCTTAVNSGTTDALGNVVITLRGGGCSNGANPFACLVKGNGVVIRSYEHAKSPDFDGAGANGSVAGPDLVNFKANQSPGPPACHDYDNNNVMNLADTIIFASGYLFPAAHSCTLQ
jgi:hypothetical protein